MRSCQRNGEKQTDSLTVAAPIRCTLLKRRSFARLDFSIRFHLLTLGARMGGRGPIGAPSVVEWVSSLHSGDLPWR